MKKKSVTLSFLFTTILALVLNGCGSSPSPTLAIVIHTPTFVSPALTPTLTPTLPTPTITPIPKGKMIVVTSAEDSGPGTLRQALLDAKPGDIITFDPIAFPPKNPVAIELKSGLPPITQGYLTLDASNAGVILDGSQAGGDWTAGIEIDSEHNIIKGLQIVHFSGPGIRLNAHARLNTIGGDRGSGLGPLGEGNLFSDTSDGVAIWGSDNILTGNLIGTDVTGLGKMGNRAPGVFLEENASRNVIGPNNIIAYNGTVGGGGVEIRSLNAQANIITANSIHDNSFTGIYYNISGSTQAVFPTASIILGFDLASGVAEGATCPACIVEIFSTSKADGEIYEGTATADQYGYFSFRKGKSFSGPSLTATSRSPETNTSEFSVPTAGTRRLSILQAGNDQPKSRLQTKRSNELADNRIGGGIWSNLWQNQDFEVPQDEIIGLGAKRVKLTINDGEPQTIFPWGVSQMDWSKPELSIDPVHDQFITDLASNGIIITYWLTFWDKANHPKGWQPVESRFKTEEEIERYLDYVRFIVRHFKGRIQYYEIWNEPDNAVPLQWIHVDDYINLVRRTVPVIREEYPEAKIVVGSIKLQNPSSRDWLFSLLGSDVMPLVDVVSWHAMFGISPKHNGQHYYEYPSLVEQIRNEASAHGFEGEYRGDDLLWRSPDCFWCNPNDPLDSNIAAAKYFARGIVMHLGLDITPGVQSINSLRLESYSTIRNLSTLMAGAKPMGLTVEIQSEATNIMSYGFTLPNGDRLLALWTDGVAVDDDPGVPATLTIPGFDGWNTTGIDILYGFEQPLITSSENGNLIIRDLLIKDYPIIIRLSK